MGTSLLIGTYTEQLAHVNGHAPGILTADFDGKGLSTTSLVARVRNPSWVTTSRDGSRAYAVIETDEIDGIAGGGIAVLDRSHSGRWELLQTQGSGGSEPAHLEIDPTGRYLIAANYGDGAIAVFPLSESGAIQSMSSRVLHSGTSVHETRQQGAHPHQVVFDPSTRRVLVPDLGIDTVRIYELTDGGRLEEHADESLHQTPGSGPRHLVFHPNGHHLFVLNELNSTLVAYSREGSKFKRTDVKSTVPDQFTGTNLASAVRVSRSGGTVLVSNRGLDAIAVFAFDMDLGTLDLVRLEPSRGRTPRDITLTPDDRFLIVANQDSDSLVVFELSESPLDLTYVSTAQAESPVCLRFIPDVPN